MSDDVFCYVLSKKKIITIGATWDMILRLLCLAKTRIMGNLKHNTLLAMNTLVEIGVQAHFRASFMSLTFMDTTESISPMSSKRHYRGYILKKDMIQRMNQKLMCGVKRRTNV